MISGCYTRGWSSHGIERPSRVFTTISQWRILPAVLSFRETSLFTKRVTDKLTHDEYLELQSALILQPELGDLIPDSGGLRKLRWAEPRRGKGKRGGVRVIYYWYAPQELIYFLLLYSKGEQDDLSVTEKKMLRQMIVREFK